MFLLVPFFSRFFSYFFIHRSFNGRDRFSVKHKENGETSIPRRSYYRRLPWSNNSRGVFPMAFAAKVTLQFRQMAAFRGVRELEAS